MVFFSLLQFVRKLAAKRSFRNMGTPNDQLIKPYPFLEMPSSVGSKQRAMNDLSPTPLLDNSQEFVTFSDTGSFEDTRSTKMIITQNIDKYVSSFTCHGLSRVFKGTKAEKIFWSALVVGGLIMATIITYGLINKYFTYNVYTEISSQVTNRYQMPAVTFCNHDLKTTAEYSFCGAQPGQHVENGNQPCLKDTKFVGKNYTEKPGNFWSNGHFTVLKCSSSGILVDCNSHNYLKTAVWLNNSCFTMNYDGSLYSNLFESSEITFQFNQDPDIFDTPSIVAYVHEPGSQNDFSRSINLMATRTTRLTFDKTIVKRLPSPFPSNCTSAKSGDIFPGVYSRISCLKSRGILHLYKKCGDIFDYAKDIIPEDIKKTYQRTRRINDVLQCFGSALSSYENEGFNNCPLPCEELDLDIGISSLDGTMETDSEWPSEYMYSVVLYFPRPGTYKLLEEKELYPWDQIACELGGFVGIALGCSLLSLFEIFVCLFLSFVKWML